jgi:transcriptional regulator with XRE-family HTH domain
MTIVSTGVYGSTSASGPMLARQLREPVLVGIMLVGVGTSSAPALPTPIRASFGTHDHTTAGPSVVEIDDTDTRIAELRRRSGLTWEQLSRLFGVSRRSLHFWASGKTMTPANEEHLERLLAVFRRIDRGSPEANRAALFEAGADGRVPFDLLVARQYERVTASVDTANVAPAVSRRPSAQGLSTRTPQPPAQLVDALQDRVHIERRRVRAAASVKARRGRGGA